MPDSLNVDRVVPSEDGFLLFLDDPAALLLVDPEWQMIRGVSLPQGVHGLAARSLPDGDFELLTASPPTILRMGPTGNELGRDAVEGPGSLVAGLAFGVSEWLLLWRLSNGQHRLTMRPGDRSITDFAWEEWRTDAPSSFWLTRAADTAVLVSRAEHPHPTVLVDVRTGRVRTFEPPLSGSGEGHRSLHAMPMVALAQGFLQTLSDVGSDDRVLARFDHCGRVLSRRWLRIPLSALGSEPGDGTVLFARRLSGLELVRYKWLGPEGELSHPEPQEVYPCPGS